VISEDSNQNVSLVRSANTDVADRAKRKERFLVTADSAPGLIWISDTTKARIWFNKPWLDFRGRTMEQEYGNGWTDGLHPDDFDRFLHIYTSNFDARTPYKMEYRLRRHDGAWRWIIANGIPLYEGPGGAFSGFIGSCIDITEMKQAEMERQQLLERERAARAEAERASRLKDEFLTTLSHELRTPLNAILGWSQLLECGKPSSEELREGLSAISRNARMQTRLIEDLLDMSWVMSGRLRLNLQEINPKEVVEQALDSVMPSAQMKGIRIEKMLNAHTGPVKGDPARLQQVIWNLLTNAVKFTPKGGKVQVLLERADSHVEISVSDTGRGIEPEFLPLVFQRFRQADATTTRRYGGLGIGLALAKQLTEMHCGTVRAKSEGEGKGATFIVRLPLSIAKLSEDEVAGQQAAQDEMHLCEEIRLEGVKVLVIDDELDTLILARRILTNCKAEVLTAGSAAEGFELFTRERPDVIVSDIGMPEADGYEFIRWVRRLPAAMGGQTPAAALTAFARSEDRRRMLMAGYQSHVVKPVELAELVTVIASLAGRTGAR
jgi:PAS domain S-box-containing protein